MTEKDTITLNFEALKETRLLFRKDEVERIMLCMKSGVNTFIYGPAGTGKTTTVRKATEKFDSPTHKAIYISCGICETEHAVLREIIDWINTSFTQKIFIQTRSNYDLIKRLKADRQKFPSLKVVVLDEFQLLEESKVVDHLLEIGFAVVLVSNKIKALNRVSPLSRSRFANTIQFIEYSRDQLVRILGSKAKRLLGQRCYKESLITRVAELCNGNIGYGESLILASVLRAVTLNKKCVEGDDVPVVSDEPELGHDQKVILEIMKEKGSLRGGDLYRSYCERTSFPKAERTFRNYMRSLCEMNLVRAIGTNRGRVYELEADEKNRAKSQ